jgi:methyl-accepting chemotaxis protein
MSVENKEVFYTWFNLDGENSKLLAETGKQILPHVDSVLERFYALILSRPETRGFFSDPNLVDHARSAQKAHWEKLFSGKFDRAYFESADRIGRVHYQIQLPFIQYLGGYSAAGSDMLDLLMQRRVLNRRKLSQQVQLVTRVMLADCERVIEAYFTAQQEEQTKALDLMTEGIGRLEQGDLTHKIRKDEGGGFPERFDGIRRSYNNLIDRWSGIIADATKRAHSVDGKMSSTARMTQEMADRAESQAATLEETVAAVSQVNTGTKEVREMVEKATHKSETNRGDAEKGGKVVRDAIEAVERIEKSSEQIAKFVDVIDDISFQTNLLALNAGVEAARAGDAGRGFAVVASEVRALAGRASQSATEIKSLIAESTTQVRDGSALVRQTGDSLADIRNGAIEVSGLMEEISNVISNQAYSLQEIDTSMAELGQTTQDNASRATSVFETTAELATDSAHLKSGMDGFSTATTSAGAASTTSAPPPSASEMGLEQQFANFEPAQAEVKPDTGGWPDDWKEDDLKTG